MGVVLGGKYVSCKKRIFLLVLVPDELSWDWSTCEEKVRKPITSTNDFGRPNEGGGSGGGGGVRQVERTEDKQEVDRLLNP